MIYIRHWCLVDLVSYCVNISVAVLKMPLYQSNHFCKGAKYAFVVCWKDFQIPLIGVYKSS